MNVRVKPEDESLIRAKVASGAYSDESEVVADALAALEAREAQKLERLRGEIAEGRKAHDEGRFVELKTDEDIDAFFASL